MEFIESAFQTLAFVSNLTFILIFLNIWLVMQGIEYCIIRIVNFIYSLFEKKEE